MFLWCVQEMAELKEEDIIIHCPVIKPLTLAAHGASNILSESSVMRLNNTL